MTDYKEIDRIRSKTIFDPIFRAKIVIAFGKINRLGINKNFQAFFEKNEEEGKAPTYYLHFEVYGFTTVVHECHHATYQILSDRGVYLDNSTKEVYAYYLDWLSGQCRDALEKWTLIKANK